MQPSITMSSCIKDNFKKLQPLPSRDLVLYQPRAEPTVPFRGQLVQLGHQTVVNSSRTP